MIEDVSIRLGGREWRGWEGFEFSESIESPVASFRFTSSKNPLNLSEPFPASEVAQIFANDSLLLTGYVDSFDLSISPASGRVLEVSGRAKPGDLADSSVDGNYRRQSGKQYIEKLIQPFGISLEIDGNLENHRSYVPELGRTILEAIYDGLQLQQKSLSVTREGNIRIRSAENRPSQGSISIGSGIKEARVSFDQTQRFSSYRVRAQDAGFFDGVQASEISADFEDNQVRFRPKYIFPSGDMDTQKAKAVAERAARRSFGRATRVGVTLSGWRSEDGDFWQPNSKIWVDIPDVMAAQEMIIQSVSLSQDADQGTQARLELQPIQAFSRASGARAATSRPVASIPAQSPAPEAPTISSDYFDPGFLRT